MSIKAAAVISVALLLVGLLLGYVWWGRFLARYSSDLAEELADAKARLAEQTQRADEAQTRSDEAEAELRKATEALTREGQAREALEEALSKGRK